MKTELQRMRTEIQTLQTQLNIRDIKDTVKKPLKSDYNSYNDYVTEKTRYVNNQLQRTKNDIKR